MQGVNLLLNCSCAMLKKISDSLSSGFKMSTEGLQLSLIVVIIVSIQLLVAAAISRAVISLILMTSGDIERNPGPQSQSGMSYFKSLPMSLPMSVV